MQRLLILLVLGVPARTRVATADDGRQIDTTAIAPVWSDEALRPMMDRTTTASALSIVNSHNGTPAPLKALINLAFQSGTDSKRFLRKTSEANTLSTKGLSQAKKMLSDMIAESGRQLDLEDIKCSDYDQTQLGLIKSTRGEISTFNAQSAEARGDILGAEESLEKIHVKLPLLNADLEKNELKCQTSIGSLTTQLKILTADLAVMAKIVKLASCSETKLMLLQCHDSGKSFVTFGRRALRKQVGFLASKISKRFVENVLSELANSTRRTISPSSLMQKTHEATKIPASGNTMTIDVPPSAAVSDKPQNKAKQTAKCSYTNNTNCNIIYTKMSTIDAGIKEKAGSLRTQLATTEKECADNKGDYEDQIELQEGLMKTSQARLASGTTKQNEADEQSLLKGTQLTKLIKEHTREMKLCRRNIGNFQGEMCAVKKIRGELMKLAGENVFADNIAVKDCSVGPWKQEACSVTCGGGTKRINREIVSQARNGGAECPPLVFEEKCEEDECPIDCNLSPWTAWSSCSALCGGGVRERERTVEIDAQHGGVPCGETSETQSCGIGSCDKDCALSEWTQWSTCSKACMSGMQRRLRSIDEPPKGSGTCAKKDDEARLEYRPCNQQDCKLAENQRTIQCDSKLDVILMLDSSKVVYADHSWVATTMIARDMVKALSNSSGIRLAFMSFSGSKLWGNNPVDPSVCSAGKPHPKTGKPLDMKKDCGMVWMRHLNEGRTDDGKTADLLKAVQYPKIKNLDGLSQPDIAMNLADAELLASRKDTRSVVIVIGGAPHRYHSIPKFKAAAQRVREKARVMFVSPGVYNLDLKRAASNPTRENLLTYGGYARHHNNQVNPKIVSNVIAALCPKLKRWDILPCWCDHGTPASGDACANHQTEHESTGICEACDAGFTLQGGGCHSN